MILDLSKSSYVGLFGYTILNAEIKNVGVINSFFSGKDNIGGISGQNSGTITQDENLYKDFVLFYEKFSSIQNASTIFSQIYEYSNHYLTIVFEETTDDKLATALSTINACFALDCYPFLMELMDDYSNKRIDSNSFYMMLQSIVDIVLKRFENPSNYNINLATLGKDINNYILNNHSERLVG